MLASECRAGEGQHSANNFVSDEDMTETKDEQTSGARPAVANPFNSVIEQVGQHVINALSQDETVAVLTTITGSNSGRQVVSIPLTQAMLNSVQHYLVEVDESPTPEAVPCVGFHCSYSLAPKSSRLTGESAYTIG